MRYIFPSVGDVVLYAPTECVVSPNMLNREWIMWDKKGTTVLLVENYSTCGARNQLVVSYDDCEYMCATYSMRNWMT